MVQIRLYWFIISPNEFGFQLGFLVGFIESGTVGTPKLVVPTEVELSSVLLTGDKISSVDFLIIIIP